MKAITILFFLLISVKTFAQYGIYGAFGPYISDLLGEYIDVKVSSITKNGVKQRLKGNIYIANTMSTTEMEQKARMLFGTNISDTCKVCSPININEGDRRLVIVSTDEEVDGSLIYPTKRRYKGPKDLEIIANWDEISGRDLKITRKNGGKKIIIINRVNDDEIIIELEGDNVRSQSEFIVNELLKNNYVDKADLLLERN